MLATSIHSPGHSSARPSTLGAKTRLSSGSSLGKIRSCPHLALSRVRFTSFLRAVTLNINTPCPRSPQATVLPQSPRVLLPHKRNAWPSVYLQQTWSHLPTMGMCTAWQFPLLRTKGRMISSTRMHTRAYILSQEAGMNLSRSVVGPSRCARLMGGIVVGLFFPRAGPAIHLRV